MNSGNKTLLETDVIAVIYTEYLKNITAIFKGLHSKEIKEQLEEQNEDWHELLSKYVPNGHYLHWRIDERLQAQSDYPDLMLIDFFIDHYYLPNGVRIPESYYLPRIYFLSFKKTQACFDREDTYVKNCIKTIQLYFINDALKNVVFDNTGRNWDSLSVNDFLKKIASLEEENKSSVIMKIQKMMQERLEVQLKYMKEFESWKEYTENVKFITEPIEQAINDYLKNHDFDAFFDVIEKLKQNEMAQAWLSKEGEQLKPLKADEPHKAVEYRIHQNIHQLLKILQDEKARRESLRCILEKRGSSDQLGMSIVKASTSKQVLGIDREAKEPEAVEEKKDITNSVKQNHESNMVKTEKVTPSTKDEVVHADVSSTPHVTSSLRGAGNLALLADNRKQQTPENIKSDLSTTKTLGM